MNVGFSSQRSFRTSQLPAGLTSLDNTVFASVLIFDFYGSSTEAQINMTVYDNTAAADGKYSRRRLSAYNLSANMNDAIGRGDVDGVSIEINNAISPSFSRLTARLCRIVIWHTTARSVSPQPTRVESVWWGTAGSQERPTVSAPKTTPKTPK
jgi:hypothetical protein